VTKFARLGHYGKRGNAAVFNLGFTAAGQANPSLALHMGVRLY
jgi:hypothetical protein